MITVSSITENTGRYGMIYTAFFYIPVNFVFNLPHYVTSYMHHTGKKKTKKRDFLKKPKNNGYEKFASGDSNPDPQNQ